VDYFGSDESSTGVLLMKEDDSSRRDFLKQTLALSGGLLHLNDSAEGSTLDSRLLWPPQSAQKKLKVVCVGAHPDDPESGCGGTLARYAELGHQITIIYLTRGERGDWTKSPDEVAAIRTREAESACKVIGAKPVFAGQIDAVTEVNSSRIQSFVNIVSSEEPDIVFTHWPVDTNLDHQVAGILTFRTYMLLPGRFQLYFFEVMTGRQTIAFTPTDYVDITPTREKKKAALFMHKSQKAEEVIYKQHHEIMEVFRGREAGVATAEAFVRLARDNKGTTPRGL
jgi:LmbE family N-acetylglucosaminyl deacetylase